MFIHIDKCFSQLSSVKLLFSVGNSKCNLLTGQIMGTIEWLILKKAWVSPFPRLQECFRRGKGKNIRTCSVVGMMKSSVFWTWHNHYTHELCTCGYYTDLCKIWPISVSSCMGEGLMKLYPLQRHYGQLIYKTVGLSFSSVVWPQSCSCPSK